MDGLSEYKKKRNFSRTPEPSGKLAKGKDNLFVIQKHHASRLHYDLRLEMSGVLRSWAVPKGPSMVKGDRRLAVETEDHPMEYGKFEGIIPQGQYGAGSVEIWDSGTYQNFSGKEGKQLTSIEGYKKGHIKFILKGKRLTGEYDLIRTEGKNWLLMCRQAKDEAKSQLTNPLKILFPKAAITKQELADYYDRISPYIIPHLRDRPISMRRFPDGIEGEKFFQKNSPSYFPTWIPRVKVMSKEKATYYPICNDKRALLFLANQVIEPHTWLSKKDKLNHPDKLVFDLDPQTSSVKEIIQGARILKQIFDDLGLVSFPMSTGSRGIHVCIPTRRELTFNKAASFAKVIARYLEEEDPQSFTTEQRKSKRSSAVFLDTYRIAHSQTAIAPYSVRCLENAPIAAPLSWSEVRSGYDPKAVTIRNIAQRLKQIGEPWQEFHEVSQSIVRALK